MDTDKGDRAPQKTTLLKAFDKTFVKSCISAVYSARNPFGTFTKHIYHTYLSLTQLNLFRRSKIHSWNVNHNMHHVARL